MKDEIKEILKYLANNNTDYEEDGHTYKILELDECKLLLDYINNLQKKEELFEDIVYKYDEIKQEKEKQEELISRLYNVISDDEENFKLLEEENKRLNNIIDELILECYNCDMTFGEFKNIWKKAYNKEYNSKDLDKLKELKENNIKE